MPRKRKSPEESEQGTILPLPLETEDETFLASVLDGRDEMNLAEFPFASLRRRGDSRKAITYEGWVTDKIGNRLRQKWTVRGDSLLGLPTEFDERVYVALMAIAARQGFESRKVSFSVYEILKIMGESTDKRHYEVMEKSLDRLKGITIKAEGAFWDNEKGELVRTVLAFGLLEEYWLRYREPDEGVRKREGVPAYILWNERMWKSIQAGYLKSLDLNFFYSLKSPVARRLYRLLDKRMWDRRSYEFDVFDLSGKLGMVRYRKPSDVVTKLKPALDELIERGFLEGVEPLLANGYRRLRFLKAPNVPTPTLPERRELPMLPEGTEGGPRAEASGRAPALPADAAQNALLSIGMAPRTAKTMAGGYPASSVIDWVEAAQWEEAQGKAIKNLAAYVRRALEQGWALPAGFKTQAQRAAEAQAEARQQQMVDELMAAQAAADEQRRQAQTAQRRRLLQRFAERYGTAPADFELWDRVLWDVQVQVDFETYRRFFAPTYLTGIHDGAALVAVPSEELAYYLSRPARLDLLKGSFAALDRPIDTVNFDIVPDLAGNAEA